jgi:nucleoside phosphorylase
LLFLDNSPNCHVIDIHGNFHSQQMTESAINLIVALPPEAKPINRHLGLVRDNRFDQYPLYRKGHISLVISGYGAQNSAAATAWLHKLNNHRPDDIWINLGIAGHPSHTVGDLFLASTIVDQESREEWSPAITEGLTCPAEKVYSVSEPNFDYSLDGLVEMEAAGFYRSAIKCTTPDKIYCLKVVSDNRDNPSEKINGKMVSQLIQQHLHLLDELIITEQNR